jgi:hypothetical protein
MFTVNDCYVYFCLWSGYSIGTVSSVPISHDTTSLGHKASSGTGIWARTGAGAGAVRGIVLHPVVRHSGDSSDEDDKEDHSMDSDALRICLL